MPQTTKLGLELLQNGAANQILGNATFAQLNQLVQAGVVDKDLATPPGSPANEALYIVAGSPTGAWAGKSGQLAYWLTSTNAWQFIVPREGMLVHVNDEDVYYSYTGSAWVSFTGSGTAFSGARVSISGNKSIPTGTLTKVAFDSEDYDDGGYVNLASSNTKIIIPVTGVYRLSFFSTFSPNTTGRRVARIQNDAATAVYARSDMPAVSGGGATTPNGGADVTLTAGTELNLAVFQDSGGALDITSNAFEKTVFSIERLK